MRERDKHRLEETDEDGMFLLPNEHDAAFVYHFKFIQTTAFRKHFLVILCSDLSLFHVTPSSKMSTEKVFYHFNHFSHVQIQNVHKNPENLLLFIQ